MSSSAATGGSCAAARQWLPAGAREGWGGVHSLHEHQQRVNVYMGVGCCCDGCGGLH